MTFLNPNNKRGLTNLKTGSNENFGASVKYVHKMASCVSRPFQETVAQNNSNQKLSSYSTLEKTQYNPNLFQYEIVTGSSRSPDSNTGPVLTFWAQPKQFDWNYGLRNARNACQDGKHSKLK
eukprot:GFUD01000135.1.p1 GENE.GFUD01000135.1~~GFUD01000135.1.p1  ORF type:complete len:122 (+),score=23.15 GFUD01000135.1:54-419(+)